MNKTFLLVLFIIGPHIVNSASYNPCNRSLAVSRQLSSVLLKKGYAHRVAQRALTTRAIGHVIKPSFSLQDGEVARKAYYAKLTKLPWGHVANDYIKEFKREEEQLHKE